VTPFGDRGRFQAEIDGEVVVKSSRTPFLAAARFLKEYGVDPATKIVMRHQNSETDALISTVGVAADLTVAETGKPIFAKWQEFEHGDRPRRA